jgi:group I intron endonuclease
MDRRFKEYLNDNYRISNLKKGNSYIFRAFSKYGLENFDFKILEFLELDKDLSKIDKRKVILEREQFYIDSIKPEYNINKTAGSNSGKIFSDLNRKNMSKGKILLFSNKEHHRKGSKHSDESKLLMILNSGLNHGITMLNEKNEILAIFKSIQEASNTTGISRNRISRCARGIRKQIVQGDKIYKFIYTKE